MMTQSLPLDGGHPIEIRMNILVWTWILDVPGGSSLTAAVLLAVSIQLASLPTVQSTSFDPSLSRAEAFSCPWLPV